CFCCSSFDAPLYCLSALPLVLDRTEYSLAPKCGPSLVTMWKPPYCYGPSCCTVSSNSVLAPTRWITSFCLCLRCHASTRNTWSLHPHLDLVNLNIVH